MNLIRLALFISVASLATGAVLQYDEAKKSGKGNKKKTTGCIGENDPNIVDPSSECPDPELKEEQAADKYEGDIDLGKKSRNAVISSRRKWPQSSDGNVYVPYTIESSLGSTGRSAVQQAIQTYNERTCIRFIQRTSQPDYVSLFAGQGCFSALGKTGGRQQLSLGRGCEYKGTAAHELMHAIGFLHEQARPDRDNHVQIIFQNIQRGLENQFTKGSTREYTTQGIAYDYSSVMHYGPTAFSRNGQPTIRPLVAGAQIGQRRGLSMLDLEKINKLYNCNGGGGGPVTIRPPTAGPQPGTCVDDLPGDLCQKYKDTICTPSNPRSRDLCKKTCGICTCTCTC